MGKESFTSCSIQVKQENNSHLKGTAFDSASYFYCNAKNKQFVINFSCTSVRFFF